jgi:hypothetical protein
MSFQISHSHAVASGRGRREISLESVGAPKEAQRRQRGPWAPTRSRSFSCSIQRLTTLFPPLGPERIRPPPSYREAPKRPPNLLHLLLLELLPPIPKLLLLLLLGSTTLNDPPPLPLLLLDLEPLPPLANLTRSDRLAVGVVNTRNDEKDDCEGDACCSEHAYATRDEVGGKRGVSVRTRVWRRAEEGWMYRWWKVMRVPLEDSVGLLSAERRRTSKRQPCVRLSCVSLPCEGAPLNCCSQAGRIEVETLQAVL